MPTPTADLANYQFIFRRVVKFAGIADPNSPEGDSIIPTAPYTADMVKKQIVQADYEVCALIASVENHTFRNKFFTEAMDPIADGARIPGYIGIHGGVYVETGPATDVYKKGRLAGSYNHLDIIKNNFIPYGSPYDLYFIDNGCIHTAGGQRAKVDIPKIPLANEADPTPTLGTPRAYQNAVIGQVFMSMRPVGANVQHRMDWEKIWTGYVQMILGDEASLPEPEQMQRISR